MDIVEEQRIEDDKAQELKRSVQVLLSSPHGKKVFAHLFDSFQVGRAIPMGLDDRSLVDYSSYLRAGVAIYEMCLNAAPELTCNLIAEMAKERIKNEAKIYVDEHNRGTAK